ncbi:TonB-dependent receptor [Flavobacterium psychrophilum]|nr:TonB-dependent receptor [Flavobacterium psychrophilum]AOE53414.1 TonB-dependent receptor [Flavobacterium psychrophilum]
MKNFSRLFFTLSLLLISAFAMAQETITGKVNDDQNMPLPGAMITIKGTTASASTGIDGTFTITTTITSGELIINYLGFNTRSQPFTITPGSTLNLGTIQLASNTEDLQEVVIVGKGIIDLEEDRRTPVAVSNISRRELVEKSGNQEFPEVMKNTPGVYVASQAGGYGDSKMFVRGFDQTNTAFMLNGQPINGMEDGNMYWSNWSGMTDVANHVQVQRGLGSSKLAISSVGGTVNIVTKATDLRKGGFAQSMFGNDNYMKNTASYNTGLMENGFGASFMLSKWSGDGYNRGTQGEGYNYFLSFGYKLNEKHLFNFLVFGAPQSHDQNFTKSIANYQQYGRKYNNNYGFLNGDYLSERTNYYHKPVLNLNWDFNINDNMNLSTVLYASYGRGGGTGNWGNGRVRTADGHIDFDATRDKNLAVADGIGTNAAYAIRNSVNNHAWYGVVSNFNHKINENFSYNAGLDIRTYKGTHYRTINNFLGLNGFAVPNSGADGNIQSPDGYIVTERYSANPWSAIFDKKPDDFQKIDYDYDERITYGGVFGQMEYATDDFSAFIQGAVSNQSHVRWDRFQYTQENEKSDKVNNTGYNVKAGASYKFAEQHTIFANAGYYSRQPYHDNIYLNFRNEVNPLTQNEKITGFEAGYRYRSSFIDVNIDAYMTRWKDRVTTTSNTDEDTGMLLYTTNNGVHQLHKGIEAELVARPIKEIGIKWFASIGDWKYDDDVLTVVRDENRNIISETVKDVKGGRVGGGAQTTWGFGTVYKIAKGLSIDADWRNYSNLYATVVEKDNLRLPAFDIMDAGITYKMDFATTSLTFRANINNLLDDIYISESTSAIKTTVNVSNTDPSLGTYLSNGRIYDGLADGNNVFFGNGRTYNISMRFNF